MASRKRSISNDADVSATHDEWNEASCPICMDHPHNAVLLICTSHGKGCRSYICDTSYRHSNCFDRFKKLNDENSDSSSAPTLDLTTSIDVAGDHTNHIPAESGVHEGSGTQEPNPDFEREGTLLGRLELGETNTENSEKGSELRCPLCRGMVLGYKVVEEARMFLNLKSRSCSHESCPFSGNYRELRKHARRIHPTVRPADVDPSRQRDWRRFENQREYNDIVSAIRSAMPGAIVLGDYVIDNGDRLSGERDRGVEGGRWLSTLFLFQMIGSVETGAEVSAGRGRIMSRHRRSSGNFSRRASRNFSRRRYLWGENLLGIQDDVDEDEEEDDESELNIVSHNDDDDDDDDEDEDDEDDDDVPRNPRRRRRLTWARSDEDEQ